MQDLTFVHMTDIHISGSPDDQFLGMDTSRKLDTALQAIKRMNLAPRFIVVSGDLSHKGDAASYERLRGIQPDLESFGVPVLLALGNHDQREPFYRVMLGREGATEHQPYYYSQIIDDLQVLVLDSKVPGEVHGELGSEQLEWLADRLEESPTGGNLLVFHHPPLPEPVPALAGHMLKDADKLAEVLVGQWVVGILSGHVHMNTIGSFYGVPCAAGGGVAFMLDPGTDQGMRFLDGSSINLVRVRDQHMVVLPIVLPGTQAEVYHHVPGQQFAESQPTSDVTA